MSDSSLAEYSYGAGLSIVFQKEFEDAGFLDSDLELALLTAVFVKWYLTVQKATHTLVIRVFNLAPTPLDEPSARQMALRAQANAVVVNANTRRQVAARIEEGHARGLTDREIAYGTDEFDGIFGLFDRTWRNRPLTIARTEMQRAELEASVDRIRTLGRGAVTHLNVRDGDGDSFCAARNGTVVPISQPPSMAHPNCRLTVSPAIAPGA